MRFGRPIPRLRGEGFLSAAEPPLRVVADDNYPPYTFRDSQGRLQGIVVDQWREWERRAGREVTLIGLSGTRRSAACRLATPT